MNYNVADIVGTCNNYAHVKRMGTGHAHGRMGSAGDYLVGFL